LQTLVLEALPNGLKCSREELEILNTCCLEFIRLIAGEANEISERAQKNTITPENVIAALQTLEFVDFIADIQQALCSYKTLSQERMHTKSSTNLKSKFDNSGMTKEELLKEQQALFAKARALSRTQNLPLSHQSS